ncbi:hypothetical protein DFH07DRAFT_749637 [Mycena maculata]|uniref:NmrA-like domain-containing protein n=1 Tax=Mycena maculata TaxID=230809 RepID=A0AAD7IIM1_9AGAR|nr:hypothetical protein DFH07DRAFT_749637 [Mycena maculata]
MMTLLTDSTGKSATPLVKRLNALNVPILLANRSGTVPTPFKDVWFYWGDASTYNLPDGNIDRVYLIPPLAVDIFLPMKAFIDFARRKGVTRFVLMSAARIKAGGLVMGKVHAYLASLDVEYCVLHPLWFVGETHYFFFFFVLANSRTRSPTRINWLDFHEDIADIAFKALTDAAIEHTNPIMVGPEFLSYAQIAQILTEVLGREIRHRTISDDEYRDILFGTG